MNCFNYSDRMGCRRPGPMPDMQPWYTDDGYPPCGMPPSTIQPLSETAPQSAMMQPAVSQPEVMQPAEPQPMGAQQPSFGEAINRFPIAMGYVPIQRWQQPYSIEQAIGRGTIFPQLDLPFMMGRCM